MTALDWAALAACKDEDPDLFFGAEDEDLSWQDLARCTEVDSEIFFPGKGGSTREAEKVCAGCEVREPCLEYALAHYEDHGIWGGTSRNERRRIRAQRGLPVIAAGLDLDEVKVCTGPCGREKPLTAFSTDRSAPDGRKQRCRLCMAEQQARHRAAAA